MKAENSKHVLYIAVSLDGYIASQNDSLDWLFEVQGEGDNGYSEFIKNIDCIVMGRRTYDWIMKNDKNGFPYKNQKCYVFTSKKDKLEHVETISQDVLSFSKELKEKYKNIWIVGGGVVLRDYLKLNIIDEYRITIAPVLLGKGIKLFNEFENDIKLTLKEVTRMNQFVELKYIRE